MEISNIWPTSGRNRQTMVGSKLAELGRPGQNLAEVDKTWPTLAQCRSGQTWLSSGQRWPKSVECVVIRPHLAELGRRDQPNLAEIGSIWVELRSSPAQIASLADPKPNSDRRPTSAERECVNPDNRSDPKPNSAASQHMADVPSHASHRACRGSLSNVA